MNNAGITDLGLGGCWEGYSPSKSRFSKFEIMSIEFRPLTSAQKYLSIFYKKKKKKVKIYHFTHIRDDLNSVKKYHNYAIFYFLKNSKIVISLPFFGFEKAFFIFLEFCKFYIWSTCVEQSSTKKLTF